MSSSESDDENLKRFAASVDSTVFSNKLYSKKPDDEPDDEHKVQQKSQRNLEEADNIFQSEMNVSSTMQTFIGNKLSKLIGEQVEFVEVAEEQELIDSGVDNVRLLSGTKEVVKFINEPDFVENRQKVAIKRRNVDNEPEEKESTKILKSAIDPSAVHEETKLWKKKPKRQPYEYKNVKGIGYMRAPTNEFTKARNKNNWNESKIKNAKRHSPPICDAMER